MAGGECDSVVEMFRLQLSELDVLQSMFPHELQLDDPSVVADVNEFVEKKMKMKMKRKEKRSENSEEEEEEEEEENEEDLPARIDFVVNLQLDDKMKMELACTFPHEYPRAEPEIFVRSANLARHEQHRINEDLASCLARMERGDACVYSVIQWLQENAHKYLMGGGKAKANANANERSNEQEEEEEDDDDDDKKKEEDEREKDKEEDDAFCRYWIYSHHIYNKMKRRNILDLAKELDLTGFCLPGKPGIICAEGIDSNCTEFWDRVKNMHWKKIMCKMKERAPLNKECSHNNFRRFSTFEEVAFEVRRGPGREYHMDMGEFYQYLEQHRCGYVFKSYFGVDGRLTNHD